MPIVSFMDVRVLCLSHFKLTAMFTVLILVIPLATSLSFDDHSSFNFPSFDEKKLSLNLSRDAHISGSAIQLTKTEPDTNLTWSLGRAIYPVPVRLWDKATGNLADFTTNFSFSIQSPNQNTADGMAFFLAPNGSSFPNRSEGANLGLESRNKASDPNIAFVAVEFDTYPNEWEPPYRHIGIDINSVNSPVTVEWRWNKVETSGRVNASIRYSSATQTLEVLLIDADASVNGSSRNSTSLNSTINMSEYLPEWVVVGFSATTAIYYETHAIYSWEFTSSLETTNKRRSPSPSPPVSPQTRRSNTLVWIFTSIGVFVSITITLGFIWFFCHYRQKKDKRNEKEEDDPMPPIDEEFEKVTTPRKFSYSELVIATDNFSDRRLLGEGGFGKVFEGYLSRINTMVAIKKVTPGSRQGMKEFATEVRTISQLRHKNLVQLTGWCHEKKDLLLIYEFMTNGSLDSHLFKGKSCLMWETRHGIAQGLASALLYLHDEWEHCVVHRDIKSSNIMLDSSFNAKLGDFGLARLVDHAKGSQTTVLAGTLGYMAPEYVYTSKASKHTDVYSFGVVLLEIACGRRAVEPEAEDGNIILVDWVWELYGIGKLLDAADLKLEGNFEEKEIERLMTVGLWCAHPKYKLRPTIREVISVLNSDVSPPLFPPKLAMLTYFAPSPNMSAFSLISSYNSASTSDGGNYTSESLISTTTSKTISSAPSSSLVINELSIE